MNSLQLGTKPVNIKQQLQAREPSVIMRHVFIDDVTVNNEILMMLWVVLKSSFPVCFFNIDLIFLKIFLCYTTFGRKHLECLSIFSCGIVGRVL